MTAFPAHIRPATAKDASTLSLFAAAVFPYGGRQNADPEDLAKYIAAELTPERFLALIENQNTEIWLAEAADGVCGYAVLAQPSFHPKIDAVAPAELRKLYVAPAYHGTGVAHTLMRQAIASLESRHLEVLWLSTYSENPRAVAFYKRCGFYIVGTQDFLVGNDRQKDFVMRRDLPLAKGTK